MTDLLDRIREIINEPRKQAELMRNGPLWNQLCSCLDVIGDTEMAIEAYAGQQCGTIAGALYVATYGVLQALFLQQDATINLSEALGIQDYVQNHPQLLAVREIRNDSIGHPTKRDRKKGSSTTFHFISRPTLHYGGFQLMSSDGIGNDQFHEIALVQLIEQQSATIRQILSDLIVILEQQEETHKAQFTGQSLEAMFAQTNYALEKLAMAARRPTRDTMALGKIGLQQVESALQGLQSALEQRCIQLDTYPPINMAYIDLEYPIARLTGYFADYQTHPDSEILHQDASIYVFFVRAKLDLLQGIAREIDEEYTGGVARAT